MKDYLCVKNRLKFVKCEKVITIINRTKDTNFWRMNTEQVLINLLKDSAKILKKYKKLKFSSLTAVSKHEWWWGMVFTWIMAQLNKPDNQSQFFGRPGFQRFIL